MGGCGERNVEKSTKVTVPAHTQKRDSVAHDGAFMRDHMLQVIVFAMLVCNNCFEHLLARNVSEKFWNFC